MYLLFYVKPEMVVLFLFFGKNNIFLAGWFKCKFFFRSGDIAQLLSTDEVLETFVLDRCPSFYSPVVAVTDNYYFISQGLGIPGGKKKKLYVYTLTPFWKPDSNIKFLAIVLFLFLTHFGHVYKVKTILSHFSHRSI